MNLSECENTEEVLSMSKCKKYSFQSIVNDLCIFCDNNNGFFRLYNETNS